MLLNIELSKIAHKARSATGLSKGSYFALSRLLRSRAQAQPYKGAVFVPFWHVFGEGRNGRGVGFHLIYLHPTTSSFLLDGVKS